MERNDMLGNDLKLEKEETQNSDKETHHSDQETIISGGYIGSSDFITWTIVAAIGTLFCFIHAHQENFYKWTAPTSEGALSYQAKVVVSVMSTIIAGCGVTVLVKAIR